MPVVWEGKEGKRYWHEFFLLREFLGWRDDSGGGCWPGNPEFIQRLANIRARYCSILVLVSIIDEEERQIMLSSRGGWDWLYSKNHAYVKDIISIAQDFGLKPVQDDKNWWPYLWLHQIVTRDLANSRSGESLLLQNVWFHKTLGGRVPDYYYEFSVTGKIEPWSTKKDIQKAILKQFNDYWELAFSKFESVGWGRAKGRALATHMHWLYLAIYPDKDLGRPMNFYEIADQYKDTESINENSVRRVVTRLAKELGIKLSHRPRRSISH